MIFRIDYGRAFAQSLILLLLLFFIQYNCVADPSYNPIIYKKLVSIYKPILINLGATKNEVKYLLILAMLESGGVTEHNLMCYIGGCDHGQSWSVWQLQCIDSNIRTWKASRLKWFLINNNKTIFKATFMCNELKDPIKSSIASLLLFRYLSVSSPDLETTALKWGYSYKPTRIMQIRSMAKTLSALE